MAKTPPIDQDQLVRDLRELILKGYRFKDLMQYLKAETSYAEATRKRYIAKARESFKQIDKKIKDQLRSKYRERLEKMYNDALTVKKDVRLALDIQKELNKLVESQEEAQTMPDLRVIFQQEDSDESK